MKNVVAIAIGGLVLGALTACSTAHPTATPGVERLGASLVRYQGPALDVLLSYRYADINLGSDWLLLDVALTGHNRAAVEVSREKVSLRAPSGDIVPLASQEEFGQAYGQLHMAIVKSEVMADPLDYYGGRQPCALQFLVVPGEGVSLPSAWIDDRRVCTGKLFFSLPTGVQNGQYELRIDLPEIKVRVPFKLGRPAS
jgi:hypothetical protein